MKIILPVLLVYLLTGSFTTLAKTKPALPLPIKPPRLVITIVIDQFRADHLQKWKDRFRKDGFLRLTGEGAIFPFATYPALQNMTCPGHVMIATGSVPAKNGIPLNDWFNPLTRKLVNCTDDPDFGQSPRRLVGDTLADEMKMRWPESKSVGVSFKDRGAIMLAGRSADAAYWFHVENNDWESSNYYKRIPDSLKHWSAKGGPRKDDMLLWKNSLGQTAFEHTLKWGTAESFVLPQTLDQTISMAEAAIEAHGLGQDETPDFLGLSLSAHDFVGHHYGPDSAESEDDTLQTDRVLSDFFKYLDKKIPGGMKSVWITLTADHGVAPIVAKSKSMNLDAGQLDIEALRHDLNGQLKERFSSCRNGDWIVGSKSLHLYWDDDCIARARAVKKEVDRFAKDWLMTREGILAIVNRLDYDSGIYPAAFEKEVKKSYFPAISGDLIIIPQPFWYEVGAVGNHLTAFTYDRTVPLIFWGVPFKPGLYNEAAEIIDAAPTMAQTLRILAPSLSEGKVLSQIIVPSSF